MKKYLYIALLFCRPVFAEDDVDLFKLEMNQKNCVESTVNFGSASTSYSKGEVVFAELSTVINCAAKVANPELYIGNDSLTLAVDEVFPSGVIEMCKCRTRIDFKFVFPEFKEYRFEELYFTVNGAVQSKTAILNK
ncbi:hypothetical protein ACJJIR_07660 [Microbulbifer sp. SSSA008]|uniref:hypothetical protein n=1 Tax=Microbulbifer sp. SSSA008 TaxID=3243380 RepID=UPI00403A5CCD